MILPTRSVTLLLLCCLAATAATTERATLRYTSLPPGSTPQALATDTAGNVFAVAVINEVSGRPQFRVVKIRPGGDTLATTDFGGKFTGWIGGDQVTAAAVDQMGNLVLTGITFSPDFPLVSPLFSKIGRSVFVIKFDPQLKSILFSTILGGASGSAVALTIDNDGNIYVTGTTADPNFPLTPGALRTEPPEPSPMGGQYLAFIEPWYSPAFSGATSTPQVERSKWTPQAT